MKLVVLLSVAALVACDYSAPQSEKPSDAYVAPDKVEALEETSAPIDPAKSFFGFNSAYRGAFPPARFPPANFFSSPSFHSFGYPFKAVNLAATPQGILPPLSQIVPPQISQIVPPIFGNTKPALPAPVPALPAPIPVLPSISTPLLNKFTFPHYSPLYPHSYAFNPSFPSTFTSSFPSAFPSTFSFPPTTFFPSQFQKQPPKPQTESLSTSYGPPAADPEPAGQAETSAPFEPSSPVSFPYEPAAPEAQEPAAGSHKPAQEYGLPPPN